MIAVAIGASGCGRIAFDPTRGDATDVAGLTELALPPGGHVSALALVQALDEFYVGYVGGRLYRVISGTWIECVELPSTTQSLAVRASDGAIAAIVDNEVMLSTDGCASFAPLAGPTANVVTFHGDELFAGTKQGLQHWISSSTSWNTVAGAPFPTTTINDVSSNEMGLALAAGGGAAVYDGVIWHSSNTTGRTYHIAFDPTTAGRLYATADQNFYVSTDGGVSFSPTTSGFCDELAVDPSQSGHLLRMSGNSLQRSVDAGASWSTELRSAAMTNGWVEQMVFDPAASGAVLAGTGHGLFRADAAGLAWTRIDAEHSLSSITDIVVRGELIYVATSSGMFRSTTGTAGPWQELYDWSSASSYVDHVVLSDAVPDRVYMAGDVLVASDDGGATWSDSLIPRASVGFAFHDIVEHAPLTGTPDVWAATELNIERLIGGGTGTWTVVQPASTYAPYRSLLVRRSDSMVVATSSSGMLWSSDGTTFSEWSTGLPILDLEGAIAELSDGTIVIGSAVGAFATSGPGTPWTSFGLSGTDVRDLLVDGESVYAASDAGLFVTRDRGGTWSELPGLAGQKARALALTSDHALLIGTQGHGLYRLALPQ